jgi:hypothetical protein
MPSSSPSGNGDGRLAKDSKSHRPVPLFCKLSQRITLLFFFTEKKKRSKKRKAYCLPFYKKAMYHTTGSVMRLDYAQQKSPGGVTGGCCRRNTALFER